MPDITVRFRFDTTTGEKEIVVEYEGEDDRLPVEHERRHREIVERLVGAGTLTAEEAAGVKVERVRTGKKAPPAGGTAAGAGEKEPVKT